MGDRGNIAIRQDVPGDEEQHVFLYAHWTGYDLPATLQRALKEGQSRWTDPAYLARIIFCRMVGEKEWAEPTGFGISTYIGDNQYPILEVDAEKQTVRLRAEKGLKLGAEYGPQWSFEAFTKLPDPTATVRAVES